MQSRTRTLPSGPSSGTGQPPSHSQPAGHRSGERASAVSGETEGADAAKSSRRVGRYLVSPLIKVLENGWFASSVSIRSGSGSATTDRVLRFARVFRCAREATAYAHAEGLRWIGAAGAPRFATH